jgi:hypothetical protein
MKHTKHEQQRRQKAHAAECLRRERATARFTAYVRERCSCGHSRGAHLIGLGWCLLCVECRRFTRAGA